MKLISRIFVGLLGAFMCAMPAFAADLDCDNEYYRTINPKECEHSETSFALPAPLIAGPLALGASVALTLMLGSNNSNGHTSGEKTRQPTTKVYDTVGYVDPDALNAILSDPNYIANFAHYNEIRLAYSLARGFTGKNSTIAILDTGDYGWHGTAVATVAGGVIAPDATIVPVKVVNNYGEFLPYSEIGNIISSATGANIFNSSWGIPVNGTYNAAKIKTRAQMASITGENFIQSIVDAANRDAIFVWAAGNDGAAQSNALSAMPLVIPELEGHFINVVAWDTSTGALADYSNQCGVTKFYCITAPGTKIDVEIGYASGTSFATPMVSGAIAVIQEAFPYMRAVEITQLLFVTARDLGEEGVDEVYGWGMLDLERATRPVGSPLVPLNGGMLPMPRASASGIIGQKIASANLKFAFFDSFGRAFEAKLNDNVSFIDRPRGLERLRGDDQQIAVNFGGLEIGLKNDDLLSADGFLATSGNHPISFVGARNEFEYGNFTFFQNARMGFSRPVPAAESFISGFSDVISGEFQFGAKYHDWKLSVSALDTIISGRMSLNLPVGRAASGDLLFANNEINLAQRPPMEYSLGYKFFTASFIDNPMGRNEFFIMAKTKFIF
ncbi:MAG: S8 family serine peptidase [Alphaproteobacteria bacterium]|nr:S8 family serine peptidase [Alphaproteobacteria bacterium]